MVTHEGGAVWTSAEPAAWPSPPAEMTVSALAEIEACPRRWALNAAEYPRIWAGRGYPPRPQESALAGSVVHLVLEMITRELVHAGCSSVEDARATLVLRQLGGYTKVVHQCIDRVLEWYAANPRAVSLLETTQASLRRQAPVLRVRSQSILARVRLPLSTIHANAGIPSRRRGPLSTGVYPEIELRAPRIRWRGKADLLVVSDDGCAITDFKTGAPDESHKFQVQVYALLWALDEELNPNQRPVNRLVLAYDGANVEVCPPTARELANLEDELVRRRDVALATLAAHPPEARPSETNCGYCSVRQLCGPYWESASNTSVNAAIESRFTDVELKIRGRHGILSWDAVVVRSGVLAAGRHALLRTTRIMDLRSSERVRLLGAALGVDPEHHDEPAIITLGTFSEIYSVV